MQRLKILFHAWLLTLLASSAGGGVPVYLCLGDDGHLALESGAEQCCMPDPAIGAEASATPRIAPAGMTCDPCTDIPLFVASEAGAAVPPPGKSALGVFLRPVVDPAPLVFAAPPWMRHVSRGAYAPECDALWLHAHLRSVVLVC